MLPILRCSSLCALQNFWRWKEETAIYCLTLRFNANDTDYGQTFSINTYRYCSNSILYKISQGTHSTNHEETINNQNCMRICFYCLMFHILRVNPSRISNEFNGKEETLSSARDISNGRYNLWDIAYQGFLSSPLYGIGLKIYIIRQDLTSIIHIFRF